MNSSNRDLLTYCILDTYRVCTEISRNISISFDQTFREISHSFGSRRFREISVVFGNFGRRIFTVDSAEVLNNSRTVPFKNVYFSWFSLIIDLNCERKFKNLKFQKCYENLLVQNLPKYPKFSETLLSEGDRNFAKHFLPKLTKTISIKIVNLLIFIDNSLEIGKIA